MACERNARKRHNTIAFWLSDEERAQVEARIAMSGLQKGEYYRRSILGQKVEVTAGRYMSYRLSVTLRELWEEAKEGDDASLKELVELIRELLETEKGEND